MTFELKPIEHNLRIDGCALNVSALRREGNKAPILFLHGFGSTKEDYADIQRQRGFDQHGVLTYDAPGFGKTICDNESRVDIPFLVKTAAAMLDAEGIERFHVVGHSMGGLTALMLACEHPERVLSFCSIEGNIAPEDCFLSRQIYDYPDLGPRDFLDLFIERVSKGTAWSSRLFSVGLAHKVHAEAVPGIFTSMVQLSDDAGLMDKYLSLPCQKMFMYGDENASLSYLSEIARKGVELAEIPESGHFPMYANPPEMWHRLSQFIASNDPG